MSKKNQKNQPKKQVKAQESFPVKMYNSIKSKKPVFKFLGIFAGILIVYFWFINSGFRVILDPYFHLSAKVTGTILSIFIEDISISKTIISCPMYSMSVGFGCEGLDPVAIFAAVITASPVKFGMKWPGLLIGIPTLLILNLIRLIFLFIIGIHFQSAFETFHITIFPIFFIIIVLVFLVLWQKWILRKRNETLAEK